MLLGPAPLWVGSWSSSRWVGWRLCLPRTSWFSWTMRRADELSILPSPRSSWFPSDWPELPSRGMASTNDLRKYQYGKHKGHTSDVMSDHYLLSWPDQVTWWRFLSNWTVACFLPTFCTFTLHAWPSQHGVLQKKKKKKHTWREAASDNDKIHKKIFSQSQKTERDTRLDTQINVGRTTGPLRERRPRCKPSLRRWTKLWESNSGVVNTDEQQVQRTSETMTYSRTRCCKRPSRGSWAPTELSITNGSTLSGDGGGSRKRNTKS